MPRFVLLYHDCPPHFERPPHWDLMFESGGMLRTWSLPRLPNSWIACRVRTAAMYPECPQIAGDDTVGAQQLADHRLEYLDKEGPLSGDRGHVRQIDRGTYDAESESPKCWKLTLTGALWQGIMTIRVTEKMPQWTLAVQESTL